MVDSDLCSDKARTTVTCSTVQDGVMGTFSYSLGTTQRADDEIVQARESKLQQYQLWKAVPCMGYASC